jgi:hypothetical protein
MKGGFLPAAATMAIVADAAAREANLSRFAPRVANYLRGKRNLKYVGDAVDFAGGVARRLGYGKKGSKGKGMRRRSC